MMLIGRLLGLFICIPIWYFLLYSILCAINSDRLIWFLFWIYVPVNFFAAIIIQVAESKK